MSRHEKQEKINKRIKNTFTSILSEKAEKGVTRCVCIFLILLAMTVTIILLACIIIKNSNQKVYFDMFNNGKRYNELMMQLGETSITLKMLNFYNYQGKNSSYIYKKMINAPNFMN